MTLSMTHEYKSAIQMECKCHSQIMNSYRKWVFFLNYLQNKKTTFQMYLCRRANKLHKAEDNKGSDVI